MKLPWSTISRMNLEQLEDLKNVINHYELDPREILQFPNLTISNVDNVIEVLKVLEIHPMRVLNFPRKWTDILYKFTNSPASKRFLESEISQKRITPQYRMDLVFGYSFDPSRPGNKFKTVLTQEIITTDQTIYGDQNYLIGIRERDEMRLANYEPLVINLEVLNLRHIPYNTGPIDHEIIRFYLGGMTMGMDPCEKVQILRQAVGLDRMSCQLTRNPRHEAYRHLAIARGIDPDQPYEDLIQALRR